jgi:iron complex outermembrane recepter protein
MTFQRTPVASAAALYALLASHTFTAAQVAAPAAAASAPDASVITVTGIRASLESAINIKRNANANVDAITAVDVGTNADMSLILFNGHTVSGGDWYVTDQLSSSRSTSLSLMPSSVLNSATIYKTSQANLVDGGLAGTINVTTRRPLDELKSFGGVISLGGVYADLPGRTSPLPKSATSGATASRGLLIRAAVVGT